MGIYQYKINILHTTNEVNKMITDYKNNINKFSNKISEIVKDDQDLINYLNLIKRAYSDNYFSILDEINVNRNLQRKDSDKIKKLINFYNERAKKETQNIDDILNAENAINILHTNNDRLFNKLLELKIEVEKEFTNIEDNSHLLKNKYFTVTLPKGN